MCLRQSQSCEKRPNMMVWNSKGQTILRLSRIFMSFFGFSAPGKQLLIIYFYFIKTVSRKLVGTAVKSSRITIVYNSVFEKKKLKEIIIAFQDTGLWLIESYIYRRPAKRPARFSRIHYRPPDRGWKACCGSQSYLIEIQ